jgi:hypothetical protein
MSEQTFSPEYENSWALVMGVDQYQHLPPLAAATQGARDLAETLQSNYSFQTTLLLDADVNRETVFNWLNHVRRIATPDDRVMVYFAGHGMTRGTGIYERGYLALAHTRPDEWHTTLAMDDVVEESHYLPTKHLLYVLDCCFGGLALEGRAVADTPRELAYYLTRPVRYAISAGGREVVDDSLAPDGRHSIFTYHLLRWLTDEGINPPGSVWRARELGNYLEHAVARARRSGHKPNHNYLPGSGDGDFVFRWETGAHLPTDLQVALTSQRGYVRWGAVAELIDVARGDDQAMVELAGKWLSRMRGEDPDDRVRSAAQSYFDEEEALRLAQQNEIRQVELDARLEEAARQQREAEQALQRAREIQRQAEEEQKRLEQQDQERKQQLEEAQKARQITPPAAQPASTPEPVVKETISTSPEKIVPEPVKKEAGQAIETQRPNTKIRVEPIGFWRRWWRPVLILLAGLISIVALIPATTTYSDTLDIYNISLSELTATLSTLLLWAASGLPILVIGIQHLIRRRNLHGWLFIILALAWGSVGVFFLPAYLIWSVVDALRGKNV